MEQRSWWKRPQFWLGMIVSLACLAAIFFFIEPAAIVAALRVARYEYLGLSVLGILLFMIIRAVRWRFLLKDQIPYSQVFHIQNIGYMLTMILPFRIGDIARAVLVGNVPPVTLAQGVSTMVVERVLDLLFIVALLPFTLAAVPYLPADARAAAQISGVLALSAILILIIAANRRAWAGRILHWLLDRVPFLDTATWTRRGDEFLAGLSSLTRWRDGLILLVLSVLVWIPIILSYQATLIAVHLETNLAMAGFVVCAAALSITAPSSPGQVGVFHAGVTFALVQILGQPPAESAGFAIVYHALNFLIMVILGVIGIYGSSATFGTVFESAQQLLRAKEPPQVEEWDAE